MCRWAAYIGAPIYLEDVISAPEQSLMRQSLRARESKTETNGDGFGIAWYGARETPGVYHDVLPAWADHNLRSIAHQVRSHLFLAHVRASTGTATSRTNCHPFTVGAWSFMHNGQVGGYAGFRRQVDMMIDEDCYAHRNGTTDSEALFLLALGLGLADSPKAALEQATGRMEALSRASGETPHMRMTVAFTNGETLYAARYASDEFAPSLYHRRSAGSDGWSVVSEPFERGDADWAELPPGSFATVTPDGAKIEPFMPSS
ncbi:MAG: class II glutamine amidotransferase [Pseudomonadota bacterium]